MDQARGASRSSRDRVSITLIRNGSAVDADSCNFGIDAALFFISSATCCPDLQGHKDRDISLLMGL